MSLSCPLPVPRAPKRKTRDGKKPTKLAGFVNYQVQPQSSSLQSLQSSEAQTRVSAPHLQLFGSGSSLHFFAAWKRAKFSFINTHWSWGLVFLLFEVGRKQNAVVNENKISRIEWASNEEAVAVVSTSRTSPTGRNGFPLNCSEINFTFVSIFGLAMKSMASNLVLVARSTSVWKQTSVRCTYFSASCPASKIRFAQ